MDKYENGGYLENKILILGGGPAGLSCGLALSKKGIKCTLLEKEENIGGLAKTLHFKEENLTFHTDIGPHRFFSKNKELYKIIEDLLGKDWIKVNRSTRQLIEGKFYDYPIKAMQAFKNVGYFRAVKMGLSYVRGVTRYKLLNKKVENFEDYVAANFGLALGEFNMLNYTEKVWGLPCSEIHADWANQRIKGLSLTSAIANSVFKKEGPKTLVDAFYYPKHGTGTIYEGMAKEIKKSGSKILTASSPAKINYSQNKISSVECVIKGKKKILAPKTLVSSIPLTEFMGLLSPSPPKIVMSALKKLRWRAQVYLFVTIDKEFVTKDNWIYLPERKLHIGRIAEMKNFSTAMSPKGKTSLFLEFFVNEGDEIWNKSAKELFEIAVKELESINLLKRADIRNYYLIKKKNVYPVYDLNYQENLKEVKSFLDGFENLYYIGRPGRYKYTNQDHSLEMGILAARGIIEEKHFDLDAVGDEKEYFEKGKLKE